MAMCVRRDWSTGAALLSLLLLGMDGGAALAVKRDAKAGAAPAGGSPSKADEELKAKVKKLFEDGMVQYDLRRFDAAIALFEKAFEMRPDPVFLYNIAQAHRMAGRAADAVAFYRNYLRKAPDAPNAGDVRGWIAQLEKTAAAGPPATAPINKEPAVPYLEPKSKLSFMTRVPLDGKDYVLTGVAHRSYIGFSLYAMGLYVEEVPARRAYPKLLAQAGGGELLQLRARDLAQSFIVLGEFGKAAMLRFTRKLSAKQIADSYRDLLKENLKATTAPGLRQSTEQFLGLFQRDVVPGDEMVIATAADGLISVTTAGTRAEGPRDPTLCIDLWNMWLGPKPLNGDMKQSLVERIATLGGTSPATGGRTP